MKLPLSGEAEVEYILEGLVIKPLHAGQERQRRPAGAPGDCELQQDSQLVPHWHDARVSVIHSISKVAKAAT